MRIRIASFAVVLLATAPVFAQDWRIREPSLDGMTMTEWARALRHHDREVRSQAVDAFSKFAAATRTAIPPLLDALDDADDSMRYWIAVVLQSRPDLCKLTAPAAIRLLREQEQRDKEGLMRSTVVRILLPGDPRAFHPLLETLDRSTDREQHFLMTALRNSATALTDDDVPKVMARAGRRERDERTFLRISTTGCAA